MTQLQKVKNYSTTELGYCDKCGIHASGHRTVYRIERNLANHVLCEECLNFTKFEEKDGQLMVEE